MPPCHYNRPLHDMCISISTTRQQICSIITYKYMSYHIISYRLISSDLFCSDHIQVSYHIVELNLTLSYPILPSRYRINYPHRCHLPFIIYHYQPPTVFHISHLPRDIIIIIIILTLISHAYDI